MSFLTGESFKDDRIAFTLGEDFAHYGVKLPDGADSNFEQGFRHRRQQNQPRALPDRFVRKWLQLRVGAWRRNRYFSPDLTQEFLRKLDVPVCPVSGVVLTYSTGLDTDWSVDRIDNDGGYARTNVTIVSARVNLAKGSLNAEEILRLAFVREESHGLSCVEWAKLACIVARASNLPEYPVREALHQDAKLQNLPESWCLMAQHAMLRALKVSSHKNDLFWQNLTTITPAAIRPLLKNVRMGLDRYARSTYVKHRQTSDAFASNELWLDFVQWWMCLMDAGRLKVLRPILAHGQKQAIPNTRLIHTSVLDKAKRADSRGYA